MARKSGKAAAVSSVPEKGGMKLWRAAMYVRLSVEWRGFHGDSLETQRQIMEAYLALCPDIELAGIYTDNGATGQNFEREAFQRMLSDIEKGLIDCVIVKDLSRLGRNVVDTGFYLEKYFPLRHVRFIAVNDQYDSEKASNGDSHIAVPLKNMINEAVALDISRKVRSSTRQSMLRGEFVGARPPYGYRKDPDNCHKLLVDETTAPVVKQIFAWTLDGTPKAVIVKRLNESGVLSPGKHLASVGLITNERLIGSGLWNSVAVERILSDEVYTGDMVQGKTQSHRRKQTPAEAENWIAVRGTHEAIIDRDTFEKARNLLSRVKERHKGFQKTPYTENILRGRIFCGCCGRHMNRRRQNGKTYVYYCIANDRVAKGSCAANSRIREDRLFDTILKIVRKEAEVILGNELYRKEADKRVAERKAAIERRIAELRQETERNRVFMTGLYENFVGGVLTSTEYHEMKRGYETRMETAVQTVRDLMRERYELEEQLERYVSLAEKLEALTPDSVVTAQLVDRLIDRVTVSGTTEISIDFTFQSGFERLHEVMRNG